MNIMDEMRLTDELRRFANEWDWLDYKADDSARKLRAIADRIDAEHERVTMNVMNDALYYANEDDMAELGWIRLPKDAHDECIYVGDMLDGYGKTIEVVELRIGRSGWVIVSRDGNAYADTFAFIHHKPPTVEDVLTDFARLYDSIGGRENEDELWETLLAEYAAKFQLKEGE